MTTILPRPHLRPGPRRLDSPLVIWHADGRFTGIEGAPCGDYAAALAASWRLRPSSN
jgi:hypothetical protein